MVRAIAVIVPMALLTTPVATAAQSRWDDQVNDQLQQAALPLVHGGYGRTGDRPTGSLREAESTTLTLTLRAGTPYAILGVCDNDCADLEFRLYDSNDHEIDSDTQTHDVPIVRVIPTETTQYKLKVLMAACKTSPCFYAVGVFAKAH